MEGIDFEPKGRGMQAARKRNFLSAVLVGSSKINSSVLCPVAQGLRLFFKGGLKK
jgi:hypothetical protein